MSTPTIYILLKAEELHPGVLEQLAGLWVSHWGVTGAGKHVAPVLSPGIDASVLHLQEKTPLDVVEDAVGELNLKYVGTLIM